MNARKVLLKAAAILLFFGCLALAGFFGFVVVENKGHLLGGEVVEITLWLLALAVAAVACMLMVRPQKAIQ